MDCKLTSTKPVRARAGFALTEVLMALGITGILMVILGSISVMSSHGFAALGNYVELDDRNRIAMDQLTRDIRSANRLTTFATNAITLEDADGLDLTFTFNAANRSLTRVKSGVSSVLLRDCDSLSFTMGQRNPIAGSFDVVPAAAAATCKSVGVAWLCSKTIMGIRQNTENVQSARIVIRKQGS